MGDLANHKAKSDDTFAEASLQIAGFMVFDNLVAFSKAVETASGQALDIESIVSVDTNFVQASSGYLLLNVKEYGSEQPDNLLFLTEDKAYIFSNKNPSLEDVGTFKDILPKSFGRDFVSNSCHLWTKSGCRKFDMCLISPTLHPEGYD